MERGCRRTISTAEQLPALCEIGQLWQCLFGASALQSPEIVWEIFDVFPSQRDRLDHSGDTSRQFLALRQIRTAGALTHVQHRLDKPIEERPKVALEYCASQWIPD